MRMQPSAVADLDADGVPGRGSHGPYNARRYIRILAVWANRKMAVRYGQRERWWTENLALCTKAEFEVDFVQMGFMPFVLVCIPIWCHLAPSPDWQTMKVSSNPLTKNMSKVTISSFGTSAGILVLTPHLNRVGAVADGAGGTGGTQRTPAQQVTSKAGVGMAGLATAPLRSAAPPGGLVHLLVGGRRPG